ncbi:CU044_5270 family protein [Streptomyces sp. NPDC001380]|uniref:CU044_5270 family protein n=1 Tax=Streptomyces sp. NPDC001380 TaxID=3364566 RepID=UPI0036803CB4
MTIPFRQRSGEPEEPVPGEAGRLLPRPADPDPRAERRHRPGGDPARAAPPSPGRSGRRRRPALLAAAAAAVAAGALAVTVGVGGLPTGTAPAGSPGTRERGHARHAASPGAVRLLERAALAAAEGPGSPVPGDRYGYVRVTGWTTSLDGDTGRTGRVAADREEWTSVDGSGRTLQRDGGGTRWLDAPGDGTLSSPTYRLLERLPADPGALLRRIYAETVPGHGPGTGSTTGPDQEAFTTIGDLLRGTAVPPGTGAALYRAAARIPGVAVVPDAVDAAGRHGTAVVRDHGGERTEWIFDRGSLRLLGEREVLLRDGPWGSAGTAVTSTAVLGQGIADRPGELPRRDG